MEETRGIRIADARMAEAASTGAQVVATACPFCSQMLGSATGSSAGAGEGSGTARGGAGSLPEVKDVALLLLDGVRRGQAAPGSPGPTAGS
jgi:Fe-S oxidoreductase